ncbi:MAG: glycosyltransferase family 39 protein [Bacteroidales bacterium]|nr:glycosyltransferase family 39 protein [Bacteroidales bacterium]
MPNILIKYKFLFYIIFITLIVESAYFMYDKPWQQKTIEQKFIHGDANSYHTLAINIVEKGKFPVYSGWDTFRTPGFPLYISFFYLVFGIKPWIIIFSQIFLHVFTIVFIYFLTKQIFNNKIALISSILYAFEPNAIKLTMQFGTETLHAFLFIVSIYMFFRVINQNWFVNQILCGLLLGFTTLVRPINYYFTLLILFYLLLNQWKNRKYLYSKMFFIVFAYLLTITPWLYRNFNNYGYFKLSSNKSDVLFVNIARFKALKTNSTETKIFNDLYNKAYNKYDINEKINPFEFDKANTFIALNIIRKNILSYSIFHVKGMIKFFISPLNNKSYNIGLKIIIAMYFSIIYIFLLYGFYLLLMNKQYYILVVFFSIIFYFSFFTGPVSVSRYRIPTTPFYLIISSYAFYKFYLNFVKHSITNTFKKITK